MKWKASNAYVTQKFLECQHADEINVKITMERKRLNNNWNENWKIDILLQASNEVCFNTSFNVKWLDIIVKSKMK